MMYNISFVFDYMRSMRVAGAYPKVMVDRQHRFVMFDTILHLCNSLNLVLQVRIEASQHVISVNDCIPLDIHACACNIYQALFSLSPTPNLREPGAEATAQGEGSCTFSATCISSYTRYCITYHYSSNDL